MSRKCDFDGWATKNDVVCSDGRIIRQNAFLDDDGAKVPLVFQHFHDDPKNVLGHAILENRKDGMYAYCLFNDSERAQDVKELVKHGDLDALSIYANKVKQNGKDVLHGRIREVSVVLAGANDGAKIMNTYFEHADGSVSYDNEEVIITSGCKLTFHDENEFGHADDDTKKEKIEDEDDENETLEDVLNTLSEKQRNAVLFLLGNALETAETKRLKKPDTSDDDEDKKENKNNQNEIKHSDETSEGGNEMKYNVFEGSAENTDSAVIQHGEELRTDVLNILSADNRKKSTINSLGDEIMHAAAEYGIDNIDWLFPDAKTIQNTPEFIKRDDTWVDVFMNKSKHLAFSRVKTMFANITADEARAKGYTKGKRKVEEVITLAKRVVDPQTVYKKQALDRDDVIDITDFDAVVWLKTEMRMMLNEEIARAALVGDGRSTASDDKIRETNIIPIWKDDSLFSVNTVVSLAANATDEVKTNAIIDAIVRARKNYKGSGNPIFFTSEDFLSDIILLKDGVGHRLYPTEAEAATAIRASQIVTAPILEGLTRTVEVDGTTENRTLVGILVNPIDYAFGSDKGGAVSMFDDFDIDYNKNKYLIETRVSGALTKAYSAIVVETVTTSG